MLMQHQWRRIRNELYALIYDTNDYLLVNKKSFLSIELPEFYETFVSNKEILCRIKGNDGTPFESGIFVISIKIPDDYPYNYPIFKFITPIYHPNLFSLDYISIYTLYDWTPSLTIASMLIMIQSIMYEPLPELLCEINYKNNILSRTNILYEYRNNYSKWKNTAKMWTEKYALPQMWSIFNHNNIISKKHRNTVIYMLWVGYYLANKIDSLQYQGFIDIWIMYIMPLIVDKVGKFTVNKKFYNYIQE